MKGKGKFFKNENAVTLTALVVTIIVLIILAAISVLGLFGENGILKTAETAKVDTETASYQEELKAIEVQTRTQQIKQGLNSEEYIDVFKGNVEANPMFSNAREIEKKNETTLRIETEEGYIFYVTEEEMAYVGIEGEVEEVIDLVTGENGNVEFVYDDSRWTKNPIDVKINLTFSTTQQLQYSTNGRIWKNIESGATVQATTNGYVYARLNNGNAGGGAAKAEITHIDTIAPKAFRPTYTSTDTTITVRGTTTDSAATAKSGKSEGIKYRYRIDGDVDAEVRKWTSYTEETTHLFGNLEENKTYDIFMQARDEALNETAEVKISAETSRIPGLSTEPGDGVELVTFNTSKDVNEWTNESITIGIETTNTDSRYHLVYSEDGENYSPYINRLTAEYNKTIYAALANASGAHGNPAILEINKIDKVNPEVTARVQEVTSSKITVKATAQDKESTDETRPSGVSGIKNYYYSNDGGTTWTAIQSIDIYTFEGLTAGREYTIKVRVEDAAGNSAESAINSEHTVTTESVPDLTPDPDAPVDQNTGEIINSKVTFSKDSARQYVKSLGITVRVSSTIDTTGYTLEYKRIGDSSWQPYTGKITFTKNDVLTVRLTDGTNVGAAATCNITNIDNLGPEMTNTEQIEYPESEEGREHKLKIKGLAVDKTTEEYAASGVNKYYYSYTKYGENNYSAVQEVDKNTVENIGIEITGLRAGTRYTIKMYAVDNLDNIGTDMYVDMDTPRMIVPDLIYVVR